MNLNIFKKNSPETATLSRAERRRRTVHAKPVAECIAVQEQDGMPIEVANAMLFTPGTKLTGQMRRNCMAARETLFVSTREPKAYTTHLLSAAQSATAAQLLKWARRVEVQRRKVTRDYMKLKVLRASIDPLKLHDIAKAERTLAIMDIEAQRLDAEMASYWTEAERRLLNLNFKAQ